MWPKTHNSEGFERLSTRGKPFEPFRIMHLRPSVSTNRILGKWVLRTEKSGTGFPVTTVMMSRCIILQLALRGRYRNSGRGGGGGSDINNQLGEGSVPPPARSAGTHICRHRLSINIEGFESLNWGKRQKNGGENDGSSATHKLRVLNS